MSLVEEIKLKNEDIEISNHSVDHDENILPNQQDSVETNDLPHARDDEIRNELDVDDNITNDEEKNFSRGRRYSIDNRKGIFTIISKDKNIDNNKENEETMSKNCLAQFRIKKENSCLKRDEVVESDYEEGETSSIESDVNGQDLDNQMDDSCPEDMDDIMETSPIECEVQIKTEPGEQDITVNAGLYNGPIGDEEIFPGIHLMPRPPYVYDPDDTYRKAKKLELEKLQVEKAPRHACPHCDRIFYLNSKLKKHMQSHLEDRPYPCPICGSSHKTDYDLRSHLITHSSQRPYACPECPASFKRPSSLKSHLHVHSPIRSFACNECQANFKRKSDLLSHMPLHSEVRPFSCETCAALFKTEKGLKCHIKTHDNRPVAVRRRPRNTSAELARISELVSNNPSMTPSKDRYVCNVCFVEFNKRETLIKHMLVHSSVREFSCSQCTKTFKRRADLRSHMTVHSDYKPYSCKHCTATFKRTIEVKFHMRVHASPVQYTCNACQIVFKSKVQLSRHRSTVHKQPNYRNHCNMCDKSFRTKPELNQHLLEHCQRLQQIKDEVES